MLENKCFTCGKYTKYKTYCSNSCRFGHPNKTRGTIFHDHTGKRFGFLTVIKQLEYDEKARSYNWLCRCDCGNELVYSSKNLTSHSRSCTKCGLTGRKSHGISKTTEYSLWHSCRCRCLKRGIPFNIEISDIKIPDKCPIFGFPFYSKHSNSDFPKKGKRSDLNLKTASIDKIIPELGYVKGNIWVISLKANLIKSNATPEEIRLVADAVDKKIKEINNVQFV